MKYDEETRYFSYGDEDQDLWVLFTRARYATFRARERELQRYGITPEQAQLLFVAQAIESEATPARISRLILRQPHTVSAIVDRMEKKGLVKKVKDLDRKNMVRVVLTEKGQKAYEMTSKRGPIHRIMHTLNDEERANFRGYLERVMGKAREELGLDRDDLPSSE
jgi:MarR family transcriptional regulator, organic hydroperoxide resistance regulator